MKEKVLINVGKGELSDFLDEAFDNIELYGDLLRYTLEILVISKGDLSEVTYEDEFMEVTMELNNEGGTSLLINKSRIN